jgi:hypothetical protein
MNRVGSSVLEKAVEIEVVKSGVVVVLVGGGGCAACPPSTWSKLHLLHQFEIISNKHCTYKMLGIDYPDSDEEDVVPATQPEVRLENVLGGLR